MISNSTSELILEDKLLKKELSNLLTQRADFLMLQVRQTYYLNSVQPSRLLAMKLKTCENLANITIIKSSTGHLVTDPKDINDNFVKFCNTLYSSEIKFNKQAALSFIKAVMSLRTGSWEPGCSSHNRIIEGSSIHENWEVSRIRWFDT